MSGDSEMVERVARDVEAKFGPTGIWDSAMLRAIVRAAILAMREPTGTMVLANPAWNRDGGVFEGWRAMIDAALSQKQDGKEG